MEYRLKFTKLGNSKFIGHLDLLKMFQRAVRRAGVPIQYSGGFNPHQEMSFALPLTLGMESVGEYIDIELLCEMPVQEMKESISAALPPGMAVTDAVLLADGAKRGMAVLCAQEFEVTADVDIDDECFHAFFAQDVIMTEKKTKSGVSVVDIKPDILGFSKQGRRIVLLLSAGSHRNLKADLVMKCLYAFAGLHFVAENIRYKRVELYQAKGEKLIPLNAV